MTGIWMSISTRSGWNSIPHLDRLAAVLGLENLVGIAQHHPVDDQKVALVLRDQQPFLHGVNIQVQSRQGKSGCRSRSRGGGGLTCRRGDDRWRQSRGNLASAWRSPAGRRAGSPMRGFSRCWSRPASPCGRWRGRAPVQSSGPSLPPGVTPAEIGRLALETRWSDLLRVRMPHAGMVSGEGLERFFERVIPARTFDELRLPFAAVATDLATGRRVDLTSGPLARAVLASCSLPVLLEPVAEGGRLLVDGGVSSQLPVRAVRETLGVTPVIAVDVNVGGLEQPRLRFGGRRGGSPRACSGAPGRRRRRRRRPTW